MSIIDTPFNTVSKIPCLLSKGVTTVIRYYNFVNSSRLPRKCLELAEAQALSASGIQIAVVFQQSQDSAAAFSLVKGIAAGRRAYHLAQNIIGQPANSAIYFGVDFDADEGIIANNIFPYFEGVKKAFMEESLGSPEYRIGAYGSGLVCGSLREKNRIELAWLSQSLGHRGTRQALAAGEFHLAQRSPATTLCGLGVDFNDSNPAQPDFGVFTIGIDTAHNDFPTTIGTPHKVIARSGLRLREGPGKQFGVINILNSGQRVFVSKTIGGWAQVDVEGDGQVDGFASVEFLEVV